MRTTLRLDEDVLRELRDQARQRNITLGKAASDLIRMGLRAVVRIEGREWFLRRGSACQFA